MDANYWTLPWQEFDVVLGVKNLFSERNLNIHSVVEADSFLKSCGFDLSDASQIRQFEQIYGEAIFFIRHLLLSAQERELFVLPADILHLERPQNLVLFASSKKPYCRYKRLWACSILKVMYTISNIQFSDRLQILSDARELIFSKIKNYIVGEGEHTRFVHRQIHVDLNRVEWKEAKTRTSLMMKLLHKPDTIVDEVFDYLGVRFVVNNCYDIPLLLKILIESHIVIPHQVIAVRTRNSLLNIKNPRKIVEFLQSLYSCGTLTEQEFVEMCQKIHWHYSPLDEPHRRSGNAFTSQHYRSLQFTVRHLIRSPNPAYTVLDSMSRQWFRYTGINRQEPWMSHVIPEYYSHYFPIEIQIMDKSSYDLAKFGPASHEQYKAHQLKAVRERVLGNLLFFTPEKLANQNY